VPDSAAGEEDDALELAVVEEVVEGPEAALLRQRIVVGVRPVRVDLALRDSPLSLQSGPYLGLERCSLLGGRGKEEQVDVVANSNRVLSAEVVRSQRAASPCSETEREKREVHNKRNSAQSKHNFGTFGDIPKNILSPQCCTSKLRSRGNNGRTTGRLPEIVIRIRCVKNLNQRNKCFPRVSIV
jgi:hypothetical protein